MWPQERNWAAHHLCPGYQYGEGIGCSIGWSFFPVPCSHYLIVKTLRANICYVRKNLTKPDPFPVLQTSTFFKTLPIFYFSHGTPCLCTFDTIFLVYFLTHHSPSKSFVLTISVFTHRSLYKPFHLSLTAVNATILNFHKIQIHELTIFADTWIPANPSLFGTNQTRASVKSSHIRCMYTMRKINLHLKMSHNLPLFIKVHSMQHRLFNVRLQKSNSHMYRDLSNNIHTNLIKPSTKSQQNFLLTNNPNQFYNSLFFLN